MLSRLALWLAVCLRPVNSLLLFFLCCARCLRLQPNKVYIGGLPEQTRQEDLQACFGKIGTIVSIELKYVLSTHFNLWQMLINLVMRRLGYGFVVSKVLHAVK